MVRYCYAFPSTVDLVDIDAYLSNTSYCAAAGNHDLDFDAPSDDHSFDTFRAVYGPEYFSFEIGQVHFITLDDVKYPCDDQDNLDGLHTFCTDPNRTTYNGVITERQMQWLKNDLAHVPKDKIIFLMMHIPILSYIDMNSVQHALDNAVELWETVGCVRSPDGVFLPEDCERKVIATFGHTHTVENMYPGEDFEGWRVALDAGSLPAGRAPGPVPFHHVIVGASCGSWWYGDFSINGNPIAADRVGSPNGYFIWEFNGTDYTEKFKASEQPAEKTMSIDFSTPSFRKWFGNLRDWFNAEPGAEDIPPENINTLPDTRQILKSELCQTYLNVNVWGGTRLSKVSVHIDGYKTIEMARTQPGEGETFRETLDVFALKRQMMIARHAFVNSKDERANGFELFRGEQCTFN